MLKDQQLKPKTAAPEPDILEGMDDQQLLSLRHKIDLRLKVEIKDLNLTEELGLNYRQGKVLLESVQNDPLTPVNQKAQVFNSVGAMLSNIVKLRDVVFSAERQKRFESSFLKVLEKMPAESKIAFFDMYGEFLENKGV